MDKVVVGWGTVGKATASALNIKNYYSRSESNVTLEEVAKAKFIFICLPTPVDRGYVTKDIEDLLVELGKLGCEGIIVIRSTVYSGFNRYLQNVLQYKKIVSNPEFLSEDTAEYDAKHPDLILLGSEDMDSLTKVEALYRGIFPHSPYLKTDSVTAELTKMTLNSFFVAKVVFGNEIFDYAQQVGANYEVIKSVLESHRWGSKNHFTIFHKNGRGAGGKCLKKDIRAMSFYSSTPFFELISTENEYLLNKSGKI